MNAEEVNKLTDEEISIELERLRRHVFDMRSQAVTEKLDDPNRLTAARRDIARMLTVRRQRELGGSKTDKA